MPTTTTVKLRQKKGRYYAEFRNVDRSPPRKWVALGTKQKRVARSRLADWEYQMEIGVFDPWADKAPQKGALLRDAITNYLKAKSHRRKKTNRADRSLLGLFESSTRPGIQLRQIQQRHVESFLYDGKRSDSTLKTYFTRLKTFFKWCVQNNMLTENPMEPLRSPKKSRTVPQFLTKEQYAMLLSCIKADAEKRVGQLKDGEVVWLVDVIKLAVGTGMRISEVCHMRWSWVNLATGFITIKKSRDFTPKSGNERSIYIPGETRDVLERLNGTRTTLSDTYVFQSQRGRPGDAKKLNAEYVSKRFLHYARLAKLPEGIHFHSLRHTYASWLVMGGVDLYRVKELLGHADISTTMRYAHLSPKSFVDDVERVFGHGGEVREAQVRYAA